MVVLSLVNVYENELQRQGVVDFEGVIIEAIKVLEDIKRTSGKLGRTPRPRCIVTDEVQDFSQNELRLLSMLVPENQADNLFLVGDGSQKIYKRGFSLRNVGIDITGRAVILKKNYRNTRQIMEAAHRMISNYSFDDLDAEHTSKPGEPDYPTREGDKPLLIKFPHEDEEVDWIVEEVRRIIDDGTAKPGEIVILAASKGIREKLMVAIKRRGIDTCELRQDVALDSTRVKISTIESAKGHESPIVFVASVVEGIIPLPDVDEEGERLHASRLYVAMTRARDKLFLTWNVSGSDVPVQSPSRYLRLIQDRCDELEYRNGKVIPLRNLD